MTGRRLRLQAVVLAAVVAVSVIATGAAFVGSTVAQSNGPDNPGNGADAGGGTNTGGSDAGGGTNTGGSDAGGGTNTGGSDAGGGAANEGGADAGSTAGEDAGGAGNSDAPGSDGPAGGAGDGTGNSGADAQGPSGNDRGATAAEGAGPDIAEVGRQVSQATPDAAANVEIRDTQPDTPGTSVDFGGNTKSVSGVTLADEALRGSVDVKEYSNLPASVTDAVAETVLRDIAAKQANDSVAGAGNTTATTANASTETTTNASGDDPAARGRVSVLTVANISVFDENGAKASDADATVRMTVDATNVTNPENAVVVHETDDGWEQLNTSLADVSNETVTLSAETGGFSLFAVAELDTTDEASSSSTATDETNGTASAATDDSTPGFGIPLAVAAVSGVALLSRRLRR